MHSANINKPLRSTKCKKKFLLALSFGLLWSIRRRLYTFRRRQTQVKFGKTIESAEYIWHCQFYDIFQDFVGTPRREWGARVYNIRGGGARDRQSIRFQTFSHNDFKFYDDLFYPAHAAEGGGRKKRVAHNIGELLTPRALAYWFMDDASCLTINQKRYYLFSTHSFPLEDQERLVQALKDHFEIDATIQKHYSDYIFDQNLLSVLSI